MEDESKEKPESDKLRDELERAEEKIEEMEKKLEEQEKKTKTITHYKSEGVTLIFSIVVGLLGFMGVGHIYLGRVKRGVIILLIGIFGWIVVFVSIAILGIMDESNFDIEEDSSAIFLLIGVLIGVGGGYLVLFIWQILNARKLCRHYNDYYEKNGKAPW